MEQVDVKPTWVLAWGLFWRMTLITLGIYGVVFGILFAIVGAALISYLGVW